MSALAIKAKSLSKTYKIYPSPMGAFWETVTGRQSHLDKHALSNVDLELARGEIIGILGRNGAGKSTLLKLISGVVERTSGELEVNGRLTAILELGTGFHPEYTGRDNVIMGGMCLGMSRKEVMGKMDAIIAFSELGPYIDHPFKTYSTGMQARLTFSTAISVDPDIMLIDEALAVGDARFQMKCFKRIKELRDNKTTILLVTHDTNTVTMFCDQAIILEDGEIYRQGSPRGICNLYHKLLFGEAKKPGGKAAPPAGSADETVDGAACEAPSSAAPLQSDDHGQAGQGFVRYGSAVGSVLDWGVVDASGNPRKVYDTGEYCRFHLSFQSSQDVEDLSFGVSIKDRRGTVLWGLTNLSQRMGVIGARRGELLQVTVDCNLWLSEGEYFVTLGSAHWDTGDKIDFLEEALQIKVLGPGDIFTTSVVNLEARMAVFSPRKDESENGTV
ncbi:MAG: ABC transporter ATP-binding protein [Desulfarculaceae bacterium]|nr:ABC transporter ATP-binding protein [Desulfarculaceae bacterium]